MNTPYRRETAGPGHCFVRLSKVVRLHMIGLLAVAASSCMGPQIALLPAGKVTPPVPPPDKALICFYRKPHYSGDKVPFYVDGKRFGALTFGSWAYVVQDPGERSCFGGNVVPGHQDPAAWQRTAYGYTTDLGIYGDMISEEARFQAQPGQRYFVRMDYGARYKQQAMGQIRGELYTKCHLVDEATGMAEVARLRFAIVSEAVAPTQ